jgi:hypothetical protein
MLQASVVNLGVGVLLLPLPFLELGGWAVGFPILGAIAVFAVPLIAAKVRTDD